MLLFSVEASDIEAQHFELLKVHQFDFVSPCLVEPRVCCVILFVEGGVRLLLIPTILLWRGFDVLHLSLINVFITADVIVAPLLYLITVFRNPPRFSLPFFNFLCGKFDFVIFLSIYGTALVPRVVPGRIRFDCPIKWDRGFIGWGSILCCLPAIPPRSRYLLELSRGVLPQQDRFISHHSVTKHEEFILHSYE